MKSCVIVVDVDVILIARCYSQEIGSRAKSNSLARTGELQRGDSLHVESYEMTWRLALFEVFGYLQPIEDSSEVSS